MAPAPLTHDERLELRAPSSEVARWKAAASRQGLLLSGWLRQVAHEATKHNPVTALLTELHNDVQRFRVGQPQARAELQLPQVDEMILLGARARDVGSDLAAKILLEGPRGAFPTLFGLKVSWDAQSRAIQIVK